MVYQTMVYISEYPPKFVANIHVDRIWDLNSNEKLKGGSICYGNNNFDIRCIVDIIIRT